MCQALPSEIIEVVNLTDHCETEEWRSHVHSGGLSSPHDLLLGSNLLSMLGFQFL